MNLFFPIKFLIALILLSYLGTISSAWAIGAETTIKVTTSDNYNFNVQYKYIEKSITLKNMIEDLGYNELPLANVSGPIFGYIISGLRDVLDKKGADFTNRVLNKLAMDKLGSFIAAANYLECKPMLDRAIGAFVKRLRNETMDLGSLRSMLEEPTSGFNKDVQELIAERYYHTYPLLLLKNILNKNHSFSPNSSMRPFAVSPDGTTLALLTYPRIKKGDGAQRFPILTIWKLEQGNFVKKETQEIIMSKPFGLAFDPTGQFVAVLFETPRVHANRISVGILDLLGSGFSNHHLRNDWKKSAVFLGIGATKSIYIGEYSSSDRLSNIFTYAMQNIGGDDQYILDQTTKIHANTCNAMSARLNHEGNLLACGKKLPLQMWALVNGKWEPRQEKEMEGIEGSLLALSFSPDGDFIAMAIKSGGIWPFETKVISLWKKQEGQYVHFKNVNIHHDVQDMDFGPDGQTIAVGSSSGDITILKIEEDDDDFFIGENITPYEDRVFVKFAANKMLVSSGIEDQDRALKLWRLYEHQRSDKNQNLLLQIWLIDKLRTLGVATTDLNHEEVLIWKSLDPVLKTIFEHIVEIAK